jgi:hypothetical protein
MEKNQTILGGIDPEIKDRLVSRRDAIKKGATASAMLSYALSLGSVPVALAAMSKEAFGQAPSDILDALQFAFILENLENEFYKAVLGTSGVAAQNTAFAPVRAAIGALAQGAAITSTLAQIQKHEQAHVDFIRTAITGAGGTAPTITANDFDFTGGNGAATPGPFVRATSEPQFLLLAAQAFEDTGVRAYKGQAPRFLIASNQAADEALEAALRIHSVEARHAAKIRNLRRDLNTGETVIRYSGTVRGGGAAASGPGPVTTPPQAVVDALNLIYANEQNTTHTVNNGTADVPIDIAGSTFTANLSAIGDATTIANALSEAFDEPLTKAQVVEIVKNFIKDDASRGLP